jgi:hypothetical protein
VAVGIGAGLATSAQAAGVVADAGPASPVMTPAATAAAKVRFIDRIIPPEIEYRWFPRLAQQPAEVR